MVEHFEQQSSVASRLSSMDTGDGLAARLELARNLASESGLAVFPAVPDARGQMVVKVDAERMALPEFIRMALGLGCGVLYVDEERFDIDALFGEASAENELDELRRAAARFDGHVETLTVAFPHHNVWHLWVEQAPFTAVTSGALANFEDEYDERDDVEGPSLSEEDIDAFVQVMLAKPQIRGAVTAFKRSELARLQPEFIALRRDGRLPHPWERLLLEHLAERAEQAQQDKVAELTGKLPELAAELANVARFVAARTADMRRKVAQDYIARHSDDYLMPAALGRELAALATEARAKANSLF